MLSNQSKLFDLLKVQNKCGRMSNVFFRFINLVIAVNEVVIEDPVALKRKITELEAELSVMKQNPVGVSGADAELFLENIRNLVDLLRDASEQLLSSQLGIQHYRSFWNHQKEEISRMIEADQMLLSHIDKSEFTPMKEAHNTPRAHLIQKMRPIVKAVRSKVFIYILPFFSIVCSLA